MQSFKEEPGSHRPIDEVVGKAQKDIHTRFAMVAKARANIWATAAVTCIFIGL